MTRKKNPPKLTAKKGGGGPRAPFDRLSRDGKIQALASAQESIVSALNAQGEALQRAAVKVERMSASLDHLYAISHVTALLLEKHVGEPLTADYVAALVTGLELSAGALLRPAAGAGGPGLDLTRPSHASLALIDGVGAALRSGRVAKEEARKAAEEATCTCVEAQRHDQPPCRLHGRPTLKLTPEGADASLVGPPS